MLVLFIVFAVPVLFLLFVWGAATAYRIYFPERAIPFYEGRIVRRERQAAAGRHMPVGVREIREDQRRQLRQREAAYHYTSSVSEGLPSDWMDDLWRRRN